jgi:hypothetical protein
MRQKLRISSRRQIWHCTAGFVWDIQEARAGLAAAKARAQAEINLQDTEIHYRLME